MALNDLLPELYKLSREEMLEAIRILQNKVDHNGESMPQTTYEVWSPQITPETARLLLNMLQDDKEKHG